MNLKPHLFFASWGQSEDRFPFFTRDRRFRGCEIKTSNKTCDCSDSSGFGEGAKPAGTSIRFANLIEYMLTEGGYEQIHPAIFGGGYKFIEVAKTHELALGNNNQRMIFGRKPIYKAFEDVFSPILESIATASTAIRGMLTVDRLLDMSGQLDNYTDSGGYLERLRSCARTMLDHHQLYVQNEDDRRYLREVAWGLLFMSDILASIPPEESLDQWCPCCFRRALDGFTYCYLHRESASSSVQSTQNRKAKRLIKHLDPDILKRWKRNRSQRIDSPENLNFVSAAGLWDELLAPELQAAILFDTATGVYGEDVWQKAWRGEEGWGDINDWPEIAAWGKIVEGLPELKSLLLKNESLPSQCLSWDDFVARLYRVLDERVQKTTFPYFVLTYMQEAEEYFQHIATQPKDGRKTNTREKVKSALMVGKTPKQIAEELGVTVQDIRKHKRSIVAETINDRIPSK